MNKIKLNNYANKLIIKMKSLKNFKNKLMKNNNKLLKMNKKISKQIYRNHK